MRQLLCSLPHSCREPHNFQVKDLWGCQLRLSFPTCYLGINVTHAIVGLWKLRRTRPACLTGWEQSPTENLEWMCKNTIRKTNSSPSTPNLFITEIWPVVKEEKNWIRIEFGTELSSSVKSQTSTIEENHCLPGTQTCLKILHSCWHFHLSERIPCSWR